MKRLVSTLAAVVLATLTLAPSAQASFGFKDLDVTFADADGAPAMQAGSHPFAWATKVALNEAEDPVLGTIPDGEARNLTIDMPVGLIGSPIATPRCKAVDFATLVPVAPAVNLPNCSDSSVVGLVAVDAASAEGPRVELRTPLYNLEPPPGVAAKFGFKPFAAAPVTIEAELKETPPYNLIARVTNITQTARFFGSTATVWGNPSDPAHDKERGRCGFFFKHESTEIQLGGECPTSNPNLPFLTLPRSCGAPLTTSFAATSWRGDFAEGSVSTHDGAGEPLGIRGCAKLGFGPHISAKPTSRSATSPSGLDFNLDVGDDGLLSPDGIAKSDIQKAVVTLPEGVSVNPSQAEGLDVCSEAELEGEKAGSEPGEGCPQASKIGTTEVESPLLEGTLFKGSLFVAEPYENRFGTLLALYMTIKEPKLGINVVLAGRVESDPETGQLTTTFEGLPQVPFSHFRLHFREGARSPLVTPAACGTYITKAELTPSANPANTLTATSPFEITSGPGEAPCPTGGLPPFKPGLIAGTINNRAGGFSPFNVRLHRTDSEQEITHFSIKLPPGITGKLAGIPYCPDAAIAAAKARTGPHGGREELESPSCPAASEIGRSLAGAGVGSALTYAPGKVYLAGPYNGSKLSIAAITAGVVGPFDIGTVVVREALEINPETAEVFIDATGSDPIPHIIQGIPVHLRDIRAYVDRPDFVLNPTDCTRTSTASTLLGAGLDFSSDVDDRPVTVTTPFQAADCAALPFKPKLTMKLIGGTKRGAHPAFRAHLQMNGIGEAGIAYAQVTLPRSQFIENAHFDTICTRVQFKAGVGNGAECPAGSIYGSAKAVTPILGEPLEGPVFLRSSEHQLPDLVVALHNSQVDFNLIGRVDSVDGKLRNTFEAAPDAPVTSFDIALAGGKKGLFVNSTNLCTKKRFAKAEFIGQNGKSFNSKPVLKVKCKKRGHKGKGAKRNKRGAKRAALRHSRAAG